MWWRAVVLMVLGIGLVAGQGIAVEHDTDRVLVVGWDGADWSVIDQLLEEGAMPNLAGLIEDGDRGVLRSSLPVESPVAWSTITTGGDPGTHGIYGFMRPTDDGFVPTDGSDVRGERLWERANGSSVVMNVPQTFPPGEIEGVLVSGYLASADSTFTHPPELGDRLLADGYRIESLEESFSAGDEERFLSGLNETVAARTAAATRLLDEEDWRFGMVVYTGLDRLQHYFWEDMGEDGAYSDAIPDHYKRLDAELGTLLERVDEDTRVVVLSDHGFQSLDKYVYINDWLKQEGYLELKQREESQGWLGWIGVTQERVVDVLSSVGLLSPVQRLMGWIGGVPAELPDRSLSDIDVERSDAFAGAYGGVVYLDLDGGVDFEEIAPKLRNITDPATGERVYKSVRRGPAFYDGWAGRIPDVVLEPAAGYRTVGFLGHSEVVAEPPTKSGAHRREGIVVAPELPSDVVDAEDAVDVVLDD